MGACCVEGCKSRTESRFQKIQGHLQFFRFPFPANPKEKIRRAKWISNLQYPPNWKVKIHSVLCEKHFPPSMFYPRLTPTARKYLREDAVPPICRQLKQDHTYCKKSQSTAAGEVGFVDSQGDEIPDISTMAMTTLDPELTMPDLDLDSMGEVQVESSCHDCFKYWKKIYHLEGLIISLKDEIESMRKKYKKNYRSKGTMTMRQAMKVPKAKCQRCETSKRQKIAREKLKKDIIRSKGKGVKGPKARRDKVLNEEIVENKNIQIIQENYIFIKDKLV